MEKEELKTIKDLLEAHWNDIKESRLQTDELIVKTIQEEIQKKVNGKIDSIKQEILEMKEDDKSRGDAITHIGTSQRDHNKKLEQLIIRLDPVIQAFETNRLFTSVLVSKVKLGALIAGSLLSTFAAWELFIKLFIKNLIK